MAKVPGPLRPAALARAAGVSTDTLRTYEARGLLPAARRSPNGYREYPPEAEARVRLVRRALGLGFTLRELAGIVNVRDRGGAPCHEVRALAARRLVELEVRAQELSEACERLRGVLDHWDGILSRTPRGARAALLEALEGLVEPGRPSPHVPQGLRGRTRKSSRD